MANDNFVRMSDLRIFAEQLRKHVITNSEVNVDGLNKSINSISALRSDMDNKAKAINTLSALKSDMDNKAKAINSLSALMTSKAKIINSLSALKSQAGNNDIEDLVDDIFGP